MDVHNYKRRLETTLKQVKNSRISKKNQDNLFEFHNFCFSEGIGPARIQRYIFDLKKLAEILKKDFDKCNKEDIQRLIALIEKTNYSHNTKRGLRIAIKKFFNWTIKNPDGKSPNKEEVIKKECYVFDFAPNRALKQIADYSCKLNIDEKIDSERKVQEFIDFLPVLAYDGSSMKQIDATGVLDMAMSGTTSTLLARRWESALLVNVDNETLNRLLKNPVAMKALMSIEGFRNLNKDIETIINKSEAVKKAKKKLAEQENISPKEKKKLSEEEKEYMGKRKEIQQKLIKFATRIPIFMYLTDFRERTLKDVITKLEPGLFKKVTGLTVKDFELLVSLGVFNSNLMNDAVFKFRRYEDSSLSYTGISKHKGLDVGGYDTILTYEEYQRV